MKQEKKDNALKQFWKYLQKDTWDSWIVSMILLIILIKFVIFPGVGLILDTSLPIVIVESCSMYHESNIDTWWDNHGLWYERIGINKSEFEDYSFKNGLNKGDIIIVKGSKEYEKGDIIIFNAGTQHPLIHRIVLTDPEISTKGDHNAGQLIYDKNIEPNEIIGKSVIKIPFIGWIKLIFFEPFRTDSQQGFC